ncbi:hypothetical protein RKD27_003125 [Streptomyces sp. SAI-126]
MEIDDQSTGGEFVTALGAAREVSTPRTEQKGQDND